MTASRVLLPNFADSRYNEAVSRLRFLLQEYDSSSHGGSEGGSSRHGPVTAASASRQSEWDAEDITAGEHHDKWRTGESFSEVDHMRKPLPQTRHRVVRILEPPEYISEQEEHQGYVKPVTPRYSHRSRTEQAESFLHYKPIYEPHQHIRYHHMRDGLSSSTQEHRVEVPIPSFSRHQDIQDNLAPPSAGKIQRNTPSPWASHPQLPLLATVSGLPRDSIHLTRLPTSPGRHRPLLVDTQTSPAPTAARSPPPAEAGTSTSELAATEGAETRQLRETARQQQQLLSQLEQENSALRQMMDEMQENVQVLVLENRRLSEELLAQTSLAVTSVKAKPSIDDPEQPAESSEQQPMRKPHPGSSDTMPKGVSAAGDTMGNTSLSEELERSHQEIQRLKNRVQEHEKWLAGGYKEQQERHKAEKADLNEALGDLQARVAELQKREEESLQRVSESVRVADQARLEHAQAGNIVIGLQRQLEAQQQRLEQEASDQEQRVAGAREEAERVVQESFQRQSAQLTEQAERIAALEEDERRWKHLETEQRAKIQRLQTGAETARMDAERTADKHQQQLAQEQRLRTDAEERLSAALEKVKRSEKDSLQTTETAQAEAASLRKQLATAQAALNAAHSDRVQLQEMVNALERESSDSQLALAAAERSGAEDVRELRRQTGARERKLLTAAEEDRAAAAARLEQLETLVRSQEEVSTRLQTESVALADQLAESEATRRQLNAAEQQLQERLAETESARRRLETRCYQFGRQHEQHLMRVERLERELEESMRAAGQLAEQHQRLLDERRMLHARLMLQTA